jgi:3',5'-cyclic AMP phosphodiesterase CpdA
MLICQITDTHLKAGRKLAYGIVDTASLLERCVESVMNLKQLPDVVLLTGDLVDYGRDDEYALLANVLKPLTMPTYLIPGNHDDRDALRRAFPEHAYLRQWAPFIQYALEDYPLRIIALDTLIPGQGGGCLCDERLTWLDNKLREQPYTPTLVAMHHPPFRTGLGHMDKLGLEGADALEAVISRHPQVERLACGHLHRSIHVRFGGSIASTCPSSAHQIVLDLSEDGSDDFVLEPPGYQLHWWDGQRLITHTAVIGHFAGPYPFRDGGKLID